MTHLFGWPEPAIAVSPVASQAASTTTSGRPSASKSRADDPPVRPKAPRLGRLLRLSGGPRSPKRAPPGGPGDHGSAGPRPPPALHDEHGHHRGPRPEPLDHGHRSGQRVPPGHRPKRYRHRPHPRLGRGPRQADHLPLPGHALFLHRRDQLRGDGAPRHSLRLQLRRSGEVCDGELSRGVSLLSCLCSSSYVGAKIRIRARTSRSSPGGSAPGCALRNVGSPRLERASSRSRNALGASGSVSERSARQAASRS